MSSIADLEARIHYSALYKLDVNKLRRAILANKSIIDKYYIPKSGDSILVAGAGIGIEAIMIKDEFRLATVAIDLNLMPSLFQKENDIRYEIGDLTHLSFGNETFSLVYCNHVLEHIPNYINALLELQRVLTKGGVLFIGFPNRNRIVGYINPSQRIELSEFIVWNILDYKKRLFHKFRNEEGAHAGFTQKEFIEMSSKYFKSIFAVRNQYMRIKYRKYSSIMKLLTRLSLDERVFPSNYFICIK
jgi:ubiquinone/menaquinone biosynthesis C-methylase UbiE